MNFGKLRSFLLPFTIATVFSIIGWFGMPDRAPTYLDAIPGVSIFKALFNLPGGFIAAALAMVFSPLGIRSPTVPAIAVTYTRSLQTRLSASWNKAWHRGASLGELNYRSISLAGSPTVA